jgi:hypothetical protein
MSRPYSIRNQDFARRPALSAALDSLPISLAPVGASQPDIEIIDGQHPDWVGLASAAHEAGSAAALILDPTPPHNPVALLNLAARGMRVAMDLPWAGNPGVAGIEPRWLDPLGSVRLIVANGSSASPAESAQRAAALDALIAIHRFSGQLPEVLASVSSAAGLSVAARLGAAPCRVTIVAAGVGGAVARFGWHSDHGTMIVDVPDPSTAVPARITLTDSAGSLLHPTRYETSVRANLRRVVAALDGEVTVEDVPDYLRALRALDSI